MNKHDIEHLKLWWELNKEVIIFIGSMVTGVSLLVYFGG